MEEVEKLMQKLYEKVEELEIRLEEAEQKIEVLQKTDSVPDGLRR